MSRRDEVLILRPGDPVTIVPAQLDYGTVEWALNQATLSWAGANAERREVSITRLTDALNRALSGEPHGVIVHDWTKGEDPDGWPDFDAVERDRELNPPTTNTTRNSKTSDR